MRLFPLFVVGLAAGASSSAQVSLSGFGSLEMSDEANPVFLAGRGDGLYRSVDEQRTWTPIPLRGDFLLDQPRVVDIDIDPEREGVFYVTTSDAGLAVLRSDDRGATWTPKTAGLPADGVAEELFVIRTAPGLLYLALDVGDEQRAYKSTDRGESWTLLRTLPEEAESIEIHVRNSNIWYYEDGARGIFRSVDEGASFGPTGPFPIERLPPGAVQNAISVIQTAPDDDNVLLLGTTGPTTTVGDNPFSNAYFYSGDRGANWTRVVNTQPTEIYVEGRLVFVYASVGTNLYISRDGGQTVSDAVDIAPGRAGVSGTFLVDRRGTGVIYGGARRSTDGGNSWTLEAGVSGFLFGADETAIDLAGSTEDVAPQVRNIEVGPIDFADFEAGFSLESSAGWVELDPSQGTGRTPVTVRVFPSGLPVGVQEATITVRAPEAVNPEFEIPVRLEVTAEPVAPSSPVITTFGGTGDFGDEGDGGPAVEAEFESPQKMAFDGQGNLLIPDRFDDRVRMIGPDGVVTAFAGSGMGGFAGDGGPALDADFETPVDVAVGLDGEVYIADSSNRRVRVVSPDGVIRTFAGNGEVSIGSDVGPVEGLALAPRAVAVGTDGSVYVAGLFGVYRILPNDGGYFRWLRRRFEDIALGPDGELYGVTDTTVERLRRNESTRIAGGDEAGFAGDGGPAAGALFNSLTALVIDDEGQFFLADSGNHVVRRIDADGMVSTYAGTGIGGFSGDGGPANRAEIDTPEGLALGPDGALYIAGDRRIRKVLAPGSAPQPVLSAAGVVSAASFVNSAVAPDQIVSIFGANLAPSVEAATSTPLPTELAGVRLELIDGAGSTHAVRLFFVAPGQINALIPGEAALGAATLRFVGADGRTAQASIEVRGVRPGLFSANATGEGVAAAAAVRVAADGTQSTVDVLQGAGPVEGAPIDLGPEGDQVVLLLFGTGLRNADPGSVEVTIGGVAAQVIGLAEQGQFAGLDQLNVILPRELAGRGEVEIRVVVGGQAVNVVTVVVG